MSNGPTSSVTRRDEMLIAEARRRQCLSDIRPSFINSDSVVSSVL